MNAKEYRTATEEYISVLPSMGATKATTRNKQVVCTLFADYFDQHDDEPIQDAIRHWTTALYDTGIAINSIRAYLESLRVFFHWCETRKLINECPITHDMIPKAKPREYNLLTLDEIKMLLAEQKSHRKMTARNRAIVLFIIGTGLRSEELRSLRLSDVNMQNGIVTVRKGKGEKFRKVPLPDFAKKALDEYLVSGIRPTTLSDDDLLFGTCAEKEGGNATTADWHEWSSSGLQRMVRSYVRGITGRDLIGPHDLRHAFASIASYAGSSTRDISLSLGHASEIITQQVYIDVLDNERAAENINVRLNGFVQKP